MPVTLLTLVSNSKGYGPGHSAIAIDSTVYSFEQAFNTKGSGWLHMSLDTYLKKNAHRPAILQQLTSEVDTGRALQFINQSIANDDDYLGSGVCSSGTAGAIQAGSGQTINTSGVDRPYEVYQLVKNLGLVEYERIEWADKDSIDPAHRERCQELIDKLHAGQSPTTVVENVGVPTATFLIAPWLGPLGPIVARAIVQ